MLEFSASLSTRGLPIDVASQADVDNLISAFKATVQDLKLWQYYVLDVKREKESVQAALTNNETLAWSGPNVNGKSVVELAEILRAEGKIQGLGALGSRFGVSVDSNLAAGLVKAAFVELENASSLADAWIRIVDVLNVPLYQEWEEDTKAAMESVKNRVEYTRLDPSGPRLGRISAQCVLTCLSSRSATISRFAETLLSNRTLLGCRKRILIPLYILSLTMVGFGRRILCKTLHCPLRRHTCVVKSLCGEIVSNCDLAQVQKTIHGSGTI